MQREDGGNNAASSSGQAENEKCGGNSSTADGTTGRSLSDQMEKCGYDTTVLTQIRTRTLAHSHKCTRSHDQTLTPVELYK